jgi:hypothetical protein
MHNNSSLVVFNGGQEIPEDVIPKCRKSVRWGDFSPDAKRCLAYLYHDGLARNARYWISRYTEEVTKKKPVMTTRVIFSAFLTMIICLIVFGSIVLIKLRSFGLIIIGPVCLIGFAAPIVMSYCERNTPSTKYNKEINDLNDRLGDAERRIVPLAPYYAELDDAQRESARVYADKFRDQIRSCENDYVHRKGLRGCGQVVIDYE